MVPVPPVEAVPEYLTALCGAELQPGEAELLPGITGMPCEVCLAVAAPAVPRFLSAAG
ncbi:hypothetical protein [Qaidamihabitans albus]|uniref:hypothetical protein n=1 Tax=Qaidamihabitans albus TaxID=2795733 RepID=UPI0027DC0A11|nr:hypothetical protein [Qaidamihabitans albus]